MVTVRELIVPVGAYKFVAESVFWIVAAVKVVRPETLRVPEIVTLLKDAIPDTVIDVKYPLIAVKFPENAPLPFTSSVAVGCLPIPKRFPDKSPNRNGTLLFPVEYTVRESPAVGPL